jgi:phosphatidylinositol glycan class P protein
MEEPTSPTAPLATYPVLPEEYRSRAPEFYGFVAWTSTYLLFALFILWAFLPDSLILWLGITWYPNRSGTLNLIPHLLQFLCSDWALLLPAYSMIIVWLTYFTYFALAIRGTPSFSDLSTITGACFVNPH